MFVLNYHGHKKVTVLKSAEITGNNSCTAERMYNVKKVARLVICRGKDLPSVAIDIELVYCRVNELQTRH